MTFDPHLPLILLIFFVSVGTSATFGFGAGLLAMPLLAMFMELKTATPLMALVSITYSFSAAMHARHQVNYRNIGLLLVGALFGIPVGLYVLKGAHDSLLKIILSLVIIGFPAYLLANPHRLRLKTDRSSPVFGFLSGILSSAYNTGGPPVIIFGVLRGWEPGMFRATTLGYFFVTGLASAAGQAIAGLWTRKMLLLYLSVLPVVLLAAYTGTRIHRRIPAGKFDKAIQILLMATGVFLLIRTISAMQ